MAIFNLFSKNKEASVKVYHGYGDEEKLMVIGHVFKRAPDYPELVKKNSVVWNTKSLVRLFMAETYPNVKVSLIWNGTLHETTADDNGFFRLEWDPVEKPEKGWIKVTVTATLPDGAEINGEGKILIPHQSQYIYISDIDDTFLISHSSNLPKRLYQLFTKNAQTRKPFKDVARHYQLLAEGSKYDDVTNAFFYVSSSEWNLYEYIKEFMRTHKLPEGVFLLSELKKWYELLNTGQGKHETKYDRIKRIIDTFPHHKYVLLGDDTQKDPVIYEKVVEHYGSKIVNIYIRQVEHKHIEKTKVIIQRIENKGVDVKYYEHSAEAIEHSKQAGLIK